MEKWLNNNTVVRIVAILLAILLWVVVHLDEQGTPVPTRSDIQSRTINEVQVVSVGLNEELFHIRSIEPSYVNIVLKGKESTVNGVRPNEGPGRNQIQLDLSDISTPGEHTIELKSIGFPDDIEVAIYPTTTATVLIEEIQSKEVPIHIEILGEPAEGYIADIPIITPIRAIVNVPSSELNQIVGAKAVVDITDAQQPVEVTSILSAIDESGEEIDAVISPAAVHVIVPITSPFKTVPLQIQLINQPEPGYSVASARPSANDITIYGPEDILSGINIYDGIELDLTGLNETKVFSISLPVVEGLHQIKPESVDVEIIIVPSASKTLENIPITISGANQNYITSILTPDTGTFDITVEGAPNVLQNVDDDNIQAIVDVSNLPQGVHELQVILNLPSNVTYSGEEELFVTVEIEPRTDE